MSFTSAGNTLPNLPSAQIAYSIAGCSGHSGRYVADNIKVDKPYDQTSRWSTAKDNNLGVKSWVLLELETVGVLEAITFGKFQRPHPCNMKEFEVHIGMSRDHLTEVLRSTLKNDPKAEIFALPHTSKDGVPYPTRFVKIASLSAHGQNFNTSIWYVALSGIRDEQYVQSVTREYEHRRETVAMRHILKHLRQRRHVSTYRQLLNRTGVQLEHPLVSELYESLVLRGDWTLVERNLHALASAGLFSSYIHSCTPSAKWHRLRGTDANGDIPSRRAGHAMCMDVENGLIYLFGGYDGHKSLDDFWVYSVREGRWRVVSHSVAEEKNGPGPRACHRMVFDPKHGCIYMLGRLGDGDLPSKDSKSSAGTEDNVTEGNATTSAEPAQEPVAQAAWRNRRSVGVGTTPTGATSSGSSRSQTQDYLSEFYRYRTRGLDQGKWELLNVDTAVVGGPKLVYDHQLVLDTEAQVLYVQGGRIVDGDWSTVKYSGLYSYDLRTGKWNMLQANASNESIIPPRFGHSLVFEPTKKRLFIFAGQKDESYLSDMWEYDVPGKTLTELFSNFTAAGGPDACFAHRAVIDPSLKEIYVFGGLTKSRISAPATAGSSVSLYRYDKRPGVWIRVPVAQSQPSSSTSTPRRPSASGKRQRSDMEDEDESHEHDGTSGEEEPVARCAHQVVYDPRSRTFYMHGGNAGFTQRASGEDTAGETRLDDFWRMTLERPASEEIVRQATFEVRRQQFREMCEETVPVKALAFLQNEVSSVVDHNNPEEATIFRSLLSHLLAPRPTPEPPVSVTVSGATTGVSTPSSHGSGGSAHWTNVLPEDEDAVMVDAGSNESPSGRDVSVSVPVAAVEDSYEAGLSGRTLLSDARFKQRTAVFENLLVFVELEQKQPGGSLLDVLGDDGF